MDENDVMTWADHIQALREYPDIRIICPQCPVEHHCQTTCSRDTVKHLFEKTDLDTIVFARLMYARERSPSGSRRLCFDVKELFAPNWNIPSPKDAKFDSLAFKIKWTQSLS